MLRYPGRLVSTSRLATGTGSGIAGGKGFPKAPPGPGSRLLSGMGGLRRGRQGERCLPFLRGIDMEVRRKFVGEGVGRGASGFRGRPAAICGIRPCSKTGPCTTEAAGEGRGEARGRPSSLMRPPPVAGYAARGSFGGIRACGGNPCLLFFSRLPSFSGFREAWGDFSRGFGRNVLGKSKGVRPSGSGWGHVLQGGTSGKAEVISRDLIGWDDRV